MDHINSFLTLAFPRHLRALERRAVTTESLSAGATTQGLFVVEPTDSGDQNIETLAQAFQGTTGTTAVADPNKELEGPAGTLELESLVRLYIILIRKSSIPACQYLGL
jgi:hypothetical protein